MMEDNLARVSSSESADSTSSKKRRKRKWDQPAEILVSTGVCVPGIFPLGSLNSGTLSYAASSSEAALASTVGASSMAIPSLLQLPFVNPLATVATPKINQPKIQDELIAREIVINDADSAIRYKLTKRHTQEEIQRCSGAVVITRGKYHPPNAPADNEKPLYLHISAGSHLETTVDRIKAVDIAASMVEDIMKQNPVVNGEKVIHPFSISVFLGFEANPSLDIAIRIRGPNDQYIKHIMNETGATVVLRGQGSGNYQLTPDEERQPLHLFLSSNNPQSLEHAKILAENLLDTISREFGARRISSNVYGSVPPPQQLAHPQTTGNNATSASNSSLATSTTPAPISLAVHTNGTSYYGYGGIYPQATPLQQVALALRQSSPSLVNSAGGVQGTTAEANSSERSSSERERRRRKFQELPAVSKESSKSNQNLFQGVTFLKPSEPKSDSRERNISTIPAPKKLVHSAVNAMPPPPPRNMPPPPPSKLDFIVHAPTQKVPKSNVGEEPKQENIPDTLVKLMEYGDDEDEDEDNEVSQDPHRGDSNRLASSKPFWAV